MPEMTSEPTASGAEVANAEAEVERYETLLKEAAGRRKGPAADAPPASPPE